MKLLLLAFAQFGSPSNLCNLFTVSFDLAICTEYPVPEFHVEYSSMTLRITCIIRMI